MFIKWRTRDTDQWFDAPAGVQYQQGCRARWLRSIRPSSGPTPDHVNKTNEYWALFRTQLIYKKNSLIFQRHGNIHTSVERQSGLGHIGHAFGFHERWTDIWTCGNCCNWIRLYILCPHTGEI